MINNLAVLNIFPLFFLRDKYSLDLVRPRYLEGKDAIHISRYADLQNRKAHVGFRSECAEQMPCSMCDFEVVR